MQFEQDTVFVVAAISIFWQSCISGWKIQSLSFYHWNNTETLFPRIDFYQKEDYNICAGGNARVNVCQAEIWCEKTYYRKGLRGR